MRYFLSDTPGAGLQGDKVRCRATRCYLEVEHGLESGNLVLYYIPRTETSLFVVTCWDHAFDPVLQGLSDEDCREALVENWPTLARLLVNGMEDRYREGALIRLEDPDIGETKWFVASVAGNLDLADPAEWLGERTEDASRTVLEQSAALLQELQQNKPSLAGAAVSGFLRGVGIVAAAALSAWLGSDPDDR